MSDFLSLLWVQRVGFALGGLILGLLVEKLIVQRVHALAARTQATWDDMLVDSVRGVATVWFSAAGIYFALHVGALDPVLISTVMSVITVLVIGVAVVAAMRAAGATVELFSGESGGEMSSPTLVVNLARLAVGGLGIFIILENIGVDVTPLITALGIGGLAVALALQDTLGNLFAGVQIILAKQVRPGDYVRLSSGEEGWISDVMGRNTTIHTFPDGNLVAVPNSVLASSIVKNFTLPVQALWVSVDVGVSYDSDLEAVEAITLEVATDVLMNVDGGLTDEAPVLRYHEFGDSSINFQVRMRVRDFEHQGPIRSEFIKRLHRRYNQEGIEIPFPIRTLVMKHDEPGMAASD